MEMINTVINIWNLRKHSNNKVRKLEIGPGPIRITSFETLDVQRRDDIDYVCDLAKKLPFPDETYDVIYASHVVEHVPWYQLEEVFKELHRILKTGGVLEIWVPDGYKLCKALVDYEEKGLNRIKKDGWYRYNPNHNPYLWISGRLYTYGNGTGKVDDPNWHRSLFTEKFLKQLMKAAGLRNIKKMKNKDIRAHDHGWINLGVKGHK